MIRRRRKADEKAKQKQQKQQQEPLLRSSSLSSLPSPRRSRKSRVVASPLASLRDLDELAGALLMPMSSGMARTADDFGKKTDDSHDDNDDNNNNNNNNSNNRLRLSHIERVPKTELEANVHDGDDDGDEDYDYELGIHGTNERVSLLAIKGTAQERSFERSIERATQRGLRIAAKDRRAIEKSVHRLQRIQDDHEQRLELANSLVQPSTSDGWVVLFYSCTNPKDFRIKKGIGRRSKRRGRLSEQRSLLDDHRDDRTDDQYHHAEAGLQRAGGVWNSGSGGAGGHHDDSSCDGNDSDEELERSIRVATRSGKDKSQEERETVYRAIRKIEVEQHHVTRRILLTNLFLKQKHTKGAAEFIRRSETV